MCKLCTIFLSMTLFYAIPNWAQSGMSESNAIVPTEEQLRQRDKDHIGQRLPDFIAQGLDGSVLISGNAAHLTFYYFWYPDCGAACMDQLSLLNELTSEFHGKVDFVALSPAASDQLQQFLQTQPFTFRHYHITGEELETLHLNSGFPAAIIAVDGTIVLYISGGVTSASSNFRTALTSLGELYRNVINEYLKPRP